MSSHKIINLTPQNLRDYDLFCFKSKWKTKEYKQKQQWFLDNYQLGLRIKILYVDEGRDKMTSRGFIEYIPGKYNWRGIEADDYMVIHCIWVVGKHKRQGYGKKLLEECIADAKDLEGVVGATSKSTWLISSKFLSKNGFERIDQWGEKFELYVKYNDATTGRRITPKFGISKIEENDLPDGFVIFRSPQCPYTAGMTRWMTKFAAEQDIDCEVREITSDTRAKVFHPYGTFYIMYNGQPLAYESDPKKFVKSFDVVK